MKQLFEVSSLSSFRIFLVTCLTLLVGSCGGVGVGGTGSYAYGPITALGSIFVQGVRYECDSAIIQNDFGDPQSCADLAVGSIVRLTSGPIVDSSNGGNSAVADRVIVDTALLGPVSSVDPIQQQLIVLNQQVRLDQNTVLAQSMTEGLAGLQPGQVVEISGFYDRKTQSYLATRIDPRSGATRWMIHGPLDSIDPDNKTITIGNARISYAIARDVPEDLPKAVAERRMTRLSLAVTTAENPDFSANTFAQAMSIIDSRDARVGGIVTDVRTPTDFSINDVRIDASDAAIQGSARLAIGARASARGVAAGGVLKANAVLIPLQEEFQASKAFDGVIEVLDPATKTVTVNGTQIWLGRPVPEGLLIKPVDATLDQLSLGMPVRILATWVAQANRYEATLINLE